MCMYYICIRVKYLRKTTYKKEAFILAQEGSVHDCLGSWASAKHGG